MKKQFHLTKEGIKELEAELQVLMGERPRIAEAISLAREQGDISENLNQHELIKRDDGDLSRLHVATIWTVCRGHSDKVNRFTLDSNSIQIGCATAVYQGSLVPHALRVHNVYR
ncbi:MAG: hypothetical protein AAF413_01895 [Patescibacteria group bacterium]